MITLDLPFDFCHNCERFNVWENRISGTTLNGENFLNCILTCENKNECKVMYSMIKEELEKKHKKTC